MARTNNYLIQANQAKARFLTYDQQALIQKLKLQADRDYLYVPFLHDLYRIRRTTGDLERKMEDAWVDGNGYEEVMTLLDLVCDSREDRHLGGGWKDMSSFGNQFHRTLLEDMADPWAEKFQSDLPGFRRACLGLGGTPLSGGDAAYAIEVFDGLPVALRLWLGDEDFPARLRIYWDENAGMYLRYETMYFARSLLLDRLAERMEQEGVSPDM